MQIYHYDAETRAFLGASEADEDPVVRDTIAERAERIAQESANTAAMDIARQTGNPPVIPYPDAQDPSELPVLTMEYLMPAHSTTVAPPAADTVPPGHWPVFLDNSWTVVAKPHIAGQAETEVPAGDFNPSYGTETDAERMSRHVAWAQGIVQETLDSTARAMGYDDIKTAVTYAEEPAVPRFQTEGRELRRWRSLVWDTCYTMLAAVQAGHQEAPSKRADLVAMLPSLSGPVEGQPAPAAG